MDVTWSPEGKTYMPNSEFARRVSEELDAVPRLVETRAELHDRLASPASKPGSLPRRQHFGIALTSISVSAARQPRPQSRSGSIAAYQLAQSTRG